MRTFFKLCLAIFVAAATPALALKEYYSISRSVRALGMGGTFYGISDDQYALFYNPAGLSLYRMKSQFMLNLQGHLAPEAIPAISTIMGGGNSIANIVNRVQQYAGKPLYIGAGIMPFYVTKNFGIGLFIADAKVNFSLLGRELDSEVDLTAIADSGLVIGYGRSVGDPNLHIGFNVKAMLRAGGRRVFTVLDIAQSNAFSLTPQDLGGAGVGIDADLGAIYELKTLPWGVANRVSATLSNLLATKFTIARQYGPPPGLPRMFTLSYYTVLPGVSVIDNFHLSLDLAEFQIGGDNSNPDLGGRTGNFFKHVNLGVEMPMNGWFSLRGGIRQGYLTAGLGVSFSAMKLDLAYYAEEQTNQPSRLASHRVAFNLSLGGGSSAPAPIGRDKFAVPADSLEIPEPAPAKVEPVKPVPTPTPAAPAEDLSIPKAEPKSVDAFQENKEIP